MRICFKFIKTLMFLSLIGFISFSSFRIDFHHVLLKFLSFPIRFLLFQFVVKFRFNFTDSSVFDLLSKQQSLKSCHFVIPLFQLFSRYLRLQTVHLPCYYIFFAANTLLLKFPVNLLLKICPCFGIIRCNLFC